jgi:K+-transporting ATPase KdpF subunit
MPGWIHFTAVRSARAGIATCIPASLQDAMSRGGKEPKRQPVSSWRDGTADAFRSRSSHEHRRGTGRFRMDCSRTRIRRERLEVGSREPRCGVAECVRTSDADRDRRFVTPRGTGWTCCISDSVSASSRCRGRSSSPASASHEGVTMSPLYVIGGVVTVVLFVYLFAALLKPEWF